MGDDSLDAFLEVDLPELQRQVKASEGTMPSMKMDFKDYQSPWRLWQKSLIIKILRMNISYKLLVQCILNLWKLD